MANLTKIMIEKIQERFVLLYISFFLIKYLKPVVFTTKTERLNRIKIIHNLLFLQIMTAQSSVYMILINFLCLIVYIVG